MPKFPTSRHRTGQFERMGYNNQDRVLLLRDLQEQLTDLLRIFRIKVSRRLIGQKQCRFEQQRPGYRDPFSFASGKLTRYMP